MAQLNNGDPLLGKIYYVMERVIGFEGIDEVLQHIVKTAVSLTMADASTVRLFNIKTGMLEIKKGYGLSRSFLEQPPLSLGTGIIGRVVLSGEPFFTADVTKVTQCVYKDLALMEGIKAILSVPLKTKETIIGCITVYRKSCGEFKDTELLLLNTLAAQSVAAIGETHIMEDIQRRATFDYLTNTYNKGTIMRRFKEEIARASRQNFIFSVVFLDIDDFKRFNDTHGHLMGDKLLSDFSDILKRLLRNSDILGRYGGEEFIIIAPGNDKNGGIALAERLQEAVVHHGFLGKEGDVTGISFSAGISTFQEDGKTPEELIEKADKAMYTAKKAGKKRISVWGRA
jgi:two-component system, cell cycle response regulator